ncbi:MAG: sugar kinase [Defluviitaleaceae bacterium]|jgi:predicted NBD/HSP70 family sugar kinase|nr:putative NBD/HSP70 family sugar kinase [Defluviitalea raffinosedens]MBZ4667097.1 sugar kinase [Defluviitaleaceae bacterium]
MQSKTQPEGMKIVVLDIGGTSIKSGIFHNGFLTELKETDTNASKGGEFVMYSAKEIIRSYGEFDGIGISTAGQVDFEKGMIRYANKNIPGYTGMKIRDILESEFHVPVVVENDVNAAAIGEAYCGAGKGYQDFLCLTYGTGVGGAIVINNEIYRGSTFSAGEMGAMIIHPEDRNAAEDMYSGCYEKYASTTALVRKVMGVDSSLCNGRKIFAALDRKEVREAVDEWIKEIAFGLVSLIHIMNPSCVILGGGVMEQEYILEKVKENVMDNIMESYRHVVIHKTTLGNKAGMYGAAALFMKLCINKARY